MAISKKEAIKKLKGHLKKEYLAALEDNLSALNVYSPEVLDKLPSWGGYYLTGKGTMDDYWFVEASKSEYISFQTGGSAKYWTISKKTGKVCSIEVYGE